MKEEIIKANDQQFETFVKVLCRISGVTDYDDTDLMVLKMFLNEKYSHMTGTYIQQAFIAYSAGDLGEFEHYNNLSPKFIGRVLKHYKEYKAKKNTIKPINSSKQLEEGSDDNPYEWERSYEFILKHMKKGKPPMIANWHGAFKHLEHIKEIQQTKEEKREFAAKVKEEIESQIKKERNKMQPVSQLLINMVTNSGITLECRRRIVTEYIDQRLQDL